MGAGAGRLRQVQMAARQGARDAQRHGFADGRIGRPGDLAAALPQPVGAAVALALAPLADAKLPVPPSRAPKDADSYAGFIQAAAVPKSGTYRVTLSAPAWIDVIQNGQAAKSTAFSGATGCAGIRKSVKFDLAAAPFTVELSGTTAHAITFVVTPD